MHIEVYNDKDEPEQVVRLKLVKDGYGVMLMTVLPDGRHDVGILYICKDGIKRFTSAHTAGLPTDDKGRVLLVGE